MKESDLKPGDVTTLGNLRPGDVGEFEGIDDSTPFVLTVDSEGRRQCEYADGSTVRFCSTLPVIYRGRGKIAPAVPARIVMDSEPDRIAELEEQVRTLREFVRECATNFDCDRDAHRYQTFCRQCEARAALAATAPKGEP